MESRERSARTGPQPLEAVDATRRTLLASERTELAWWRTGLTGLAVALAVGRIVPGLDDSAHRWPYVIAGVCFALYGIAVIAYGSARRRTVEMALAMVASRPRRASLTRPWQWGAWSWASSPSC
jgi:uncharacterized membrane protein YidH (DUF202 family)